MRIVWIETAIKCCGGPIFFFSGLYVLLGGAFMVGSLYLDPDMAPVGIILFIAGVLSFLLFLILAYRSFEGQNDPGGLD
jgi:hypothetical protein